MPNLENLINERVDRYDSVPNAFEDKVVSSQKNLLADAVESIDALERKGGQVVASKANLARIDTIMAAIKQSFLAGSYPKALKSFIKEFSAQADIVDDIFKAEIGNLSGQALADEVLKQSKRSATEALIGAPIDKELFLPIRDELEKAIANNAEVGNLVKGITQITNGDDEVLGKLHRYSKQIANDSFAITDRTYQNVMAKEAGIEFFQYVGGIIKDSRDFCEKRNGKFYHRKEIEQWASLSWTGKINGTTSSTIFNNLGGHNCKHAIIPRSTESVPSPVKARAKSKGFFNE